MTESRPEPEATASRGMPGRFRRSGILVLGSIALLGAIAAAWWVVEAVRFEDGLARAKREMDSGRFREPGLWLSARLGRAVDRPEVAYWLGICEQAEGRHREAIAAWDRVPPDSPIAGRAALAQAQVLVGDLGRFADAEPRLLRAIRSAGPEAVEAIHGLSQLYFWEGRTVEMRDLIETSFDRLPDPRSELLDLWRIDYATVSVEDLQGAVDLAARRAPEDDRVRLARAYLATLDGRSAEAGRLLGDCLKARPDDPAAWRGRLRWALGTDRVAEAREALAHIPAAAPDRAESFEIRAWFARAVGDREAEFAALERFVALEPGRPRALGRLAALASIAGREDQAESYRARLTETNRRIVRYQEILAATGPVVPFAELSQLADSLGRRFEARGWRALALRLTPADPELRAAADRDRNRPEAPAIPKGSTLADLVNGSD